MKNSRKYFIFCPKSLLPHQILKVTQNQPLRTEIILSGHPARDTQLGVKQTFLADSKSEIPKILKFTSF